MPTEWLTQDPRSNTGIRSLDKENFNRRQNGQAPLTADQMIALQAGNKRFNINTFKAEINANEILPTNSFLVTLAPFKLNSNASGHLTRFMNDSASTFVMRCDSAVLPSIRLNTDDNVRRYGYGPVERVAHSVQFNEIVLTWIVDGKAKIVQFFNNWMHSIVNFNSKGGADMHGERYSYRVPFSPYEVGYKDDYANSKMTIFVYDKTFDKVMEYSLYDIFPVGINEIPVSWSDTDSMMKFSVSFVFTDMSIDTPMIANENALVDYAISNGTRSSNESKVISGETPFKADAVYKPDVQPVTKTDAVYRPPVTTRPPPTTIA